MAIAYSNLGSLYSDMDNNSKALMYFEKALVVTRQLGDKDNIALSLINIGFIHKKRNENEEAIAYFKEGLQMFEETESKKMMSATLVNIGDVYKQKGEITTAIPFYKRALAIAKEGHFVSVLKDVSEALTKAYKATNNFNEAIIMQDLYYQMRDSILNETNQKEVIKQEFKYNYEKQKVIDDKEHEKQMDVSKEKNRKQKILIWSVTLFLLLIMVFAFYIFISLQSSKKQKKIIELQNLKILESINYSKKIQESLLPSVQRMQQSVPGLFVFYKPKDIVSGDFYYFKEYENHILIACADCTGHGVPGGFMSTLGNLLLDKIADNEVLPPSLILSKLSAEIVRVLHQQSGGEIQDGMDLSLCLINKENKIVEFCGARNSIVVVSNNKAIRYKASPLPVGGNYTKKGQPIQRNFNTEKIQLMQCDSLFMYTDGFWEQSGGLNNFPMTSAEFENRMVKLSQQSNEDKFQFLISEFDKWKGLNDQADDLLIIEIKFG
jgi:serine phosphatase RsbU (regulator of sigma subunit)/Tfp pilus assembly protein PilF